jgi:hypothetical protein
MIISSMNEDHMYKMDRLSRVLRVTTMKLSNTMF